MPNNVTSYYNHDAAGQVQSILHAGSGGLLQSLYYSYDDDGRRTKIAREDGTSIYYRYDAAGRLSNENWLAAGGSGLYAFDYAFDAAGNRTRLTKNNVTTYYEYNTLNQLTLEQTAGALTYYEWQADGALATKHAADGWMYFAWDVDEALTGIATPAGILRNAYDAEMKRVRREEDDAVTYFAFDGEKLLLSRPVGAAATQYVSEGPSVYDPLVSQHIATDPAADAWYLPDALGTTLGLAAAAGLLSDTFLYDAFGNALDRTGTTPTPYRYVGAYGYFTEPTPALMLLWHRWYDRGSGRFASRDPIARQGAGAYRYVRQGPAATIDPWGLRVARWRGGEDASKIVARGRLEDLERAVLSAGGNPCDLKEPCFALNEALYDYGVRFLGYQSPPGPKAPRYWYYRNWPPAPHWHQNRYTGKWVDDNSAFSGVPGYDTWRRLCHSTESKSNWERLAEAWDDWTTRSYFGPNPPTGPAPGLPPGWDLDSPPEGESPD